MQIGSTVEINIPGHVHTKTRGEILTIRGQGEYLIYFTKNYKPVYMWLKSKDLKFIK